MPTTLLISDACVLIDMEVAGISGLMFQLDYRFAVPDILFEEELRERHEGLLGHGLNPLELAPEERWVAAVNNHGEHGRWQYVVIEDPKKLGLAIDQYAVADLDDVQIELTGK